MDIQERAELYQSACVEILKLINVYILDNSEHVEHIKNLKIYSEIEFVVDCLKMAIENNESKINSPQQFCQFSRNLIDRLHAQIGQLMGHNLQKYPGLQDLCSNVDQTIGRLNISDPPPDDTVWWQSKNRSSSAKKTLGKHSHPKKTPGFKFTQTHESSSELSDEAKESQPLKAKMVHWEEKLDSNQIKKGLKGKS